MTNKEKKYLQKISRLLAQVLRHIPEKLGLSPDPRGWVAVDDLLAALAAQDLPISKDQLTEIVRTNDKQRFTLSEAGDQIRAAQGHSIVVDLAVDAVAPPAQLFHGTAEATVPAIMAEGLRPMSRQQVHLSADEKTARKVGARHGKPVILTVAAAEMHRDGHAFFRADNGVWLTDAVPAAYLTKEEGAVEHADDKNTMTQVEISGETLKEWGHVPGKEFGRLLEIAQAALAAGYGKEQIRAKLEGLKPAPPPPTLRLQKAGDVPLHFNIEASGDEDEVKNLAQVRETMTAVIRTPTVTAAAVMPDACPAGPLGTIPVGGVVATRNAIHPGMHSADICCSVMMTDMGETDPKAVLDAAEQATHFGPGGRPNGRRYTMSQKLMDEFRENRFLNNPKILRMAVEHLGTQGDGNHFLFVGKSRKTGRTAIVTHHGSRGPGAILYKLGMEAAEKYRRKLSPETLKQNAWIPSDTDDGREYWAALQLIRKWTKANHNAIHQATVEGAKAQPGERFWNEHNFVFRRDDLFYHGKGATPGWGDYAADATGLTLIPLNMAEPVLVVRGKDADHALGFSPHGAGRNFSRSEHKRRMGEMTAEQALEAETKGLDIRFPAGGVDASELPSSYKDAGSVVRQIDQFGLAEIVDYIDPYGCMMAGDVPPFWLNKKKKARRN
ncbi:RNA 2'-phosphotransferase [Cognatiyoonia sp. IB215182]|uniref:RNA 2'-phosphotransferase n=1 Tax=Cognatiyoonia sp. IB215182 TaxID=3097353 RepID=UPI002A111E01|nr:RNA 2'-phosphotransferase [Cognatiyoonia sp. IB215182]MDX8354935.1 RNA 2'-phosphotransferase [Cognatiyoonia sp. IB215182]